jgi:hypothetical protein
LAADASRDLGPETFDILPGNTAYASRAEFVATAPQPPTEKNGKALSAVACARKNFFHIASAPPRSVAVACSVRVAEIFFASAFASREREVLSCRAAARLAHSRPPKNAPTD